MIRWIWAFTDRPLDRFEQAGTFWTTVTGSRLSPLRCLTARDPHAGGPRAGIPEVSLVSGL